MDNYKVCVRTNTDGCITEINSDAFIADFTGWIGIDEGSGDRCHHAQNNYLPLPLVTAQGVYRYKLVDGKPAERTAEEMAPDIPTAAAKPDAGERIAALEAAMLVLMEETNHV